MIPKTNFDQEISLVAKILDNKPSTRVPSKPKDRMPVMVSSPEKKDSCLAMMTQPPGKNIKPDKQSVEKMTLREIMMIAIGESLIRNPKAKSMTKPEIRTLMDHFDICMGEKEGKLSPENYLNLLVSLDTLNVTLSGELRAGLEKIEQIIDEKMG